MNIGHRSLHLAATIAIIALGYLPSANGEQASAPGAYFGLNPPGEKPELFAPGIINIPGRSVGRIAFSPDATECAFTVFESFYKNNRIMFTRFENGAWTPQTALPGIDGHEMLEPVFSRDNRRLYLTVKSPGERPTTDFWAMSRLAQGWSKPQPLPAPLNSEQHEFCLTETVDGTMYFASGRAGGQGGLDLYRTVSKPGQPLQVENLGAPLNSAADDGDPAVSPDGRILVFYSGKSTLFICFDNGKGGWTRPVDMGEGFNAPNAVEYGATFSQDGRVLFFVRFDGQKGELYWVSAALLERFRHQSETASALPAPPPPPERKAIQLAPDILQRYIGTYASPERPELTSRITLETDQLMIQVGGQPKIPLFAESETGFFLKVVDAQIEFVKNAGGEITDLLIHQGVTVKLPRTKETGVAQPKS